MKLEDNEKCVGAVCIGSSPYAVVERSVYEKLNWVREVYLKKMDIEDIQ